MLKQKNKYIRDCLETHIKEKDKTDFFDAFNNNSMYMAFENGIYDLKLCKLRDGKPEDLISSGLSTGYDFKSSFSDNLNELMDYLKSILPDEMKRNKLLKQTSECLLFNKKVIPLIISGRAMDDSINQYLRLIEITRY